jgi:lysophospholipase L1-like esterase
VAAALALLVGAASAARAQTTIVAFGDSITQGVGDDPARTEKGYPPRLQAQLQTAGVTAVVVNAGREGETTAEGVSRIDSVLNSNPAQFLLLMEGTNDIPLVSINTIAFNLNRIAQKAGLRGTQTVHATLFPRRSGAKDGDNVLTGQAAVAIRDLAWQQLRPLADPFEVFTTTPNYESLYYANGDKFHPNAAGYDVMATVFFNVLRDLDRVPPVPGRVTPANKSENVAPLTPILVELYDFGTGINLSQTSMRLNGTPVAAVLRGDNEKLELTFQPATPLRGVVTVEIVTQDLASPVNAITRAVSRFVITGTTFLRGDIDKDTRVDGRDLVMLALAFGATRGEDRYLVAADFDDDGVDDGGDLAILANNFGKSSV